MKPGQELWDGLRFRLLTSVTIRHTISGGRELDDGDVDERDLIKM